MNSIKINNSEKAAVKNEKWKNPGAKLYNELLNSFYDKSENARRTSVLVSKARG